MTGHAYDSSGDWLTQAMAQHGPWIRRYVGWAVANRADAEDVLQDVWTDVFRGIGRFDREKPFWPWLRAICRNRVRKFYRDVVTKRGACLSLTDRSVAGETERFVAEENGSDSGSAVLDRLLECMEGMSPRSRRLLELRYIEDLPVKAVAAISGRSCGCVSQTLLRARRSLRSGVLRRLRAG